MFYNGEDADCNGSGACPNADWFMINGYGNIKTSNYVEHLIDIDELAAYFVADPEAWEAAC